MINTSEHYRFLEAYYLSAPIQKLYPETSITVEAGRCEIKMPIGDQYFHAAQSLHGSVYFRMLDDAAWFAIASGQSHFILTARFTVNLLAPVTEGILTSEGKYTSGTGGKFMGESVLRTDGNVVARGKGIFVVSDIPFKQKFQGK